MAHLTARQAFDYRKFYLIADTYGFATTSEVTPSRITWTDGHETLTLTSNTNETGDFAESGDGWTGTIHTINLELAAAEVWSLTGMNYSLNTTYYDDGYSVGGKTFYNDLAELAAMLEGDDSITGSAGTDRLAGFAGMDTLSGGAGHDWLEGWLGNDGLRGGDGNDQLFGGTGEDTLQGDRGADRLQGDAGADVFDFNASSESGVGSSARDRILDFTRGEDKIDLSTIDARTSQAGNQAFSFSGSTAKANAVWFKLVDLDSNAGTSDLVIYGDVNGDKKADFEIGLLGISTLTAADLVL